MNENLTRLGLVDEEDIILDEAALALASVDHPETDLGPYHQILADIESRLRQAASDAVTPHDCADVLSLVLSGEFEFVGDQETYDDAANADLIRVLDRRRGLPVSLAILYVAAARRLGWSAYVLDVPAHVLVFIGDATESVIIDPFRRGVLVQPGQLAALLSAASQPPNRFQVAAMPNRAVLVRLLLNQATRAEDAGKTDRALEVYRRITAFAPDNGHAWWQRARLELVDRDISGARGSLTAMLEVTREPALRAKITGTLDSLAAF